MGTTAHELEQVLAHGPWVRDLARNLVREPSRADDLVQQAWVAALERPPAGQHSLRRWFAAVLRNLARQDQRAQARRQERERFVGERFVGEREPEAPSDELCATLELSKLLADAVGKLDEPYRRTIFRRDYEGLEPARIAALDGVPIKTVKTRLARGLGKLRERLDRAHRDDRSAWVGACLRLLRRSDTHIVLGSIAVNIKLVCAAVGVLLLFAWAGLSSGAAELPRDPTASTAPDVPALAALEPTTEFGASARSETRGAASGA